MNLPQLFIFVERLRKEAIGDPKWIEETQVFEYEEHFAKVVAILKLVRGAQGVAALEMLCCRGLFIDLGAVFRCVLDCEAEIYFLLEQFPQTSSNVDQFVKSFFESTIEGHLFMEAHPVQTKKIRSAMVRVLKDSHDNDTLARLQNIYKTFSGYVHANYSHIMEIYNGATCSFNLAGVPSMKQRAIRREAVGLAANSMLHAAAFIARTVHLTNLHREIVESW